MLVFEPEQNSRDDFKWCASKDDVKVVDDIIALVPACDRPPLDRCVVKVALKTGEEAGDVNELSRHTKFGVSKSPLFTGTGPEFIGEIDGNSAPVEGEIVLEESGYAVSCPLPKPTIFKKVAMTYDAVYGLIAAYCAGFQKQEKAPSGISVSIVLTSDLMDQIMTEYHGAKESLTPRVRWLRVD